MTSGIQDWLAGQGYYLIDEVAATETERAVATRVPTIIEGETGTGKTQLALLLARRLPVDTLLRIDALEDPERELRLFVMSRMTKGS